MSRRSNNDEIDDSFIDQYNKEIDEAEADIDMGNYFDQQQVEELLANRRKVNDEMRDRHKEILSQIKSAVKQVDPTAVTILYGSRATQKSKIESDWDVLILLNKRSVSIKDEQLFRHNLYELELETGEVISTLVYAANDWNTRLSVTPIYQSVQQNGIVL